MNQEETIVIGCLAQHFDIKSPNERLEDATATCLHCRAEFGKMTPLGELMVHAASHKTLQ